MQPLKKTKRTNRVVAAVVYLTAIYMSVMACYCDAFTAAGAATDSLKSKFVSLAEKLFPLSMVILIIAILITHDQRMMTAELKVGAGLCVAYIALRIVNSSAFMETFTGLGIDGGSTGGSILTPDVVQPVMASIPHLLTFG